MENYVAVKIGSNTLLIHVISNDKYFLCIVNQSNEVIRESDAYDSFDDAANAYNSIDFSYANFHPV